MSTVLVTGASSGLGLEYCRQLAAKGHDVVMVARRKQVLEEHAAQLRQQYGVKTQVMAVDLADRKQLETVAQRLRDPRRPISLLVNNAGFAPGQVFSEGDLAREEKALDVMVRAVLVLSHAAATSMRKRGRGGILNVSSVAAGTAMGTYAAHKTWVNIFTEALATELKGTGVLVTSVRPGTTRTEFFQQMGFSSDQIPTIIMLEPSQVVKESLAALSRGQIEVVPGLMYRVIDWLRQKAPRPVVRLVAGHPRTSPFLV